SWRNGFEASDSRDRLGGRAHGHYRGGGGPGDRGGRGRRPAPCLRVPGPRAGGRSVLRAHAPGRRGVAMTRNDEKSTQTTYELERRGHMLARVQWAAILALGPIALAVPLNWWAFPDSLAPRLVLLGVIAVVCTAGLIATKVGRFAAHPDAIAVCFVLAIGLCTGRLILEPPEDLDVFVGVVAASMLTTALLFPWSGRTQLVVSLAIAAGYTWLLTSTPF